MSDTKTLTAEQIIRRAIADPVVPRGDNYAEPLVAWQARSVLAALEANGLTVVDRVSAEDAREAERARCVAELRTYSADRMNAAVYEVAAGKDGGFAEVAHAAAVGRAASLLESGELTAPARASGVHGPGGDGSGEPQKPSLAVSGADSVPS